MASSSQIKKEDIKTGDIKATQMAQNKVLRLLDRSKIKDRKSSRDRLEEFDMLSIN